MVHERCSPHFGARARRLVEMSTVMAKRPFIIIVTKLSQSTKPSPSK
jgi:hypothetical protein